MTVEQRIRQSISEYRDEVYVRSDFARFGSPAQVSRALAQLIKEGRLVRLGVGVFAKAKMSVLTGNPIPVRPVESLAPAILKKLGISVGPCRLTEAYNSGQTTQLPAGIVVSTGSRRISRKIGFGGRYIEYENKRTHEVEPKT